MSANVEFTVFRKNNGPLTKKIWLCPDGSVKSDGTQCIMAHGRARRVVVNNMQAFGALIDDFPSNQALATGALRADLPDEVEVVTKQKLNGAHRPDVITRSQEFLVYRRGAPALVLVDFDSKGIPATVAARLREIGGVWNALVAIIPALATVGRVERASTSAGLYNAETGEKLDGSAGRHLYLLIEDGTDAERFLKALHDRCWLTGFGWSMVGAAGQLLERSIVDRVCGTPERLAFEGQPVLVPPISQDCRARRAMAVEGAAFDTLQACPPLNVVEKAQIRELRAKEGYRLAGDIAKAREIFVETQAERLAKRTGMDPHRARTTVQRQCGGVLLPDIELPFDDPELAGKTVADVLADPQRFEGETLADPLEGVDYGTCKARIMRRADGTLWINSFAHGRTVYELQYDEASPMNLAYIERTFPLPRWYRVQLKYDHHGYEVWVYRFVGRQPVKDKDGKTVVDENGNPVQQEIWALVSTPFSMAAWLKLVDADNAYGLRLLVADRRGQVRQVDFERAELGRQRAAEVKARLLAAGMRFAPDQENLIVDMLKELSPDVCFDTVSVTGWQANDFVTPKGVSL